MISLAIAFARFLKSCAMEQRFRSLRFFLARCDCSPPMFVGDNDTGFKHWRDMYYGFAALGNFFKVGQQNWGEH
jgi:hypothetical protein